MKVTKTFLLKLTTLYSVRTKRSSKKSQYAFSLFQESLSLIDFLENGTPTNSSLPIIDSTKSAYFADEVGVPLESSNEPHAFTARLTDSSITLDSVYESFITFYGDVECLISVEKKGTEKQHFHFYYIVNRYIQEERQWFTKWAKDLLKVSVLKNKKYMLSECVTENAPIYVLKDGEFKYKNIPEKTIEEWKLLSYKKYSKVEFAEKLAILEAQYLRGEVPLRVTSQGVLSTNYDLSDFMCDFIRLKCDYKQISNLPSMQGYARMLYLRKHADRIVEIAELLTLPILYPRVHGNLRQVDYST